VADRLAHSPLTALGAFKGARARGGGFKGTRAQGRGGRSPRAVLRARGCKGKGTDF
jgi:hypothetical protein